jgi:hypothetical protein
MEASGNGDACGAWKVQHTVVNIHFHSNINSHESWLLNKIPHHRQ